MAFASGDHKLYSQCLLGLQSHMRLDCGSIYFQGKMVIYGILLLAGQWTENLSFFLAVALRPHQFLATSISPYRSTHHGILLLHNH